MPGLSQCQLLSNEDCINALANAENLDYDGCDIAGKCPGNCGICLYEERFNRDDANWIPQPGDPQYHHWLTR